jgi:hypothetical protein
VRDALALINSQEQRIKELTEENEMLRKNNAEAADRNWKILNATKDKYKGLVKIASAEAIKAMQERLKEKAYTNNYCQEVVLASDIDQIAKEMLEGENNGV